jgi:hypothetical protein
MNEKKNIQVKPLPPKKHSIFWKILKFTAVILLEIIASKPKSYQPNLQEQIMGEKLPLSDQYYIPDDQNHQ